MKILMSIPQNDGGGAERQLRLLSDGLISIGHSVYVCIRRLVNESISAKQEYILLGDYAGIHPVMLWRLHSIVRDKQPDVLVSWLPQMDMLCSIVSFTTGVPHVMMERSNPVQQRLHRGLRLGRYIAAKYSAGVICNSYSARTYWTQVTPRPVAYINNIGSASRYSGAPSIGQINKIVIASRLDTAKNISTIIRALAICKTQLVAHNVNIHLYGDGPLYQDIYRLVCLCDLEDIFLLQNWDDSWAATSECTLFISASLLEGQPNTVLRALGSGMYVLLSKIPGHVELDLPESIYFDAKDSGQLAKKIVHQLGKRLEGISPYDYDMSKHESASVITVFLRIIDNMMLCAE